MNVAWPHAEKGFVGTRHKRTLTDMQVQSGFLGVCEKTQLRMCFGDRLSFERGFRKFDHNGDGLLDEDELSSLCRTLFPPINDAEIEYTVSNMLEVW